MNSLESHGRKLRHRKPISLLMTCCKTFKLPANLNFVPKLFFEERIPLILLFLLFFLDRRNIFYFVSSLFRPQVFVMLGISGKHFRVVSCLDSEDEVTEEIINELETRQNSTNKLPSIFKSFKFHLYMHLTHTDTALHWLLYCFFCVLIKLTRPYYSVFIEFLI